MNKPSLDELTPEQRQALLDFRARFGSRWKYHLVNAWLTGTDTPPLRQIRNQYGPNWLRRLVVTDNQNQEAQHRVHPLTRRSPHGLT